MTDDSPTEAEAPRPNAASGDAPTDPFDRAPRRAADRTGPITTDLPPPRTSSGEVTRLLVDWKSGSEEALESLLPLVYEELQKLAASYLRRERRGHTLQSADLVHEAFLRMTDGEPLAAENRTHFFAIAARTMRRILVDYARRQQAAKRIRSSDRVPLDEAQEPAIKTDEEVIAVHEALEVLSQIHPRQAQLMELRYFGGLTQEDAAEVLGISVATAIRDAQVARRWLRHKLAQRDS